ncbi:hypothetical protein OG563_33130 [Nocardia vinacea]|uniref:Superfamily III holin-X n=1 Tax=Nocardia vinacea TaxID=96468 RepID=A0ABZ1YLA4_9NOCA|nr:hypothetical protein [Nocardia vinacea]
MDSSPLAPRISRTPENPGDILDRQLTRATAKETHEYYMELLRFARSTLVMLAVALTVAGGVLATGTAIVAHLAGMPLPAALGLGALGGSSGVAMGSVKLRGYVAGALTRLKADDQDPPADPPTSAADSGPRPDRGGAPSATSLPAVTSPPGWPYPRTFSG